MRISTTQVNQSGLREILNRQIDVQRTQLQISTQREFINPSDNPIVAVESLTLESDISLLNQYNVNADSAEASNALEESVLTGVTDILFRMKELMISLGNGTYSAQELEAIRLEMEERFEETIGLANTQNSNGDFLFSGFKTSTQPFSRDAAGNINYNGDQGQRELQISSGILVGTSDSGFDVFVDIRSGDGRIVTGANTANTGTGIVQPRGLTGVPFITNSYEVQFTSATTFDFVDLGPPVATVGSGNYTDGSEISFAGINVAIEGEPQAGDVFTIEPSRRQSLFETVDQVISSLENFSESDSGRALLRNQLIALDSSLDNAMDNVDVTRAKIGSRLNAIDSERDTNANIKIVQQTTLSDIRDLDIVEAASRLSQQITALEAAQASFVRVQNLTIFNFI